MWFLVVTSWVGNGEGREREGEGEWEWQNKRGLKGMAPTEREGIGWVEWQRVVDGWDYRKQWKDRGGKAEGALVECG